MYKITLIANKLRIGKSAAESIITRLNDLEIVASAAVQWTAYAGHAVVLASEAVREGSNCLIAAGGDGTLNEVINGADPVLHPHLIFGLIPAGTGNDFFRTQFGKYQESGFFNAFANQGIKLIDLGKVSYNSGQRYFINIADVGFGAYAAKILDRQRKAGLGGGISYTLAIIRAFAGYKKSIVHISSESFNHEGRIMMLNVCNGPAFADGLIICPGARTDDGWLNICCIGQISFMDYLKNYLNLKKGIQIRHPEVKYAKVQSLNIVITEGTSAFELDGEVLEGKLLEFTVLPSAIKFIKPVIV